MKQIWPDYSYSPATNVLTLTGLNIDRDQLLLVAAPIAGGSCTTLPTALLPLQRLYIRSKYRAYPGRIHRRPDHHGQLGHLLRRPASEHGD
jgi:hypothetical protein